MAHPAHRGPAADRGRPHARTSGAAGPPGRSEPGGKQEPGSRAGAADPPSDHGLSSSIAFLLGQLHDAAAAHDPGSVPRAE